MTKKSNVRSQLSAQRFDEAFAFVGSNFLETTLDTLDETHAAMYRDELTGLLDRRGFGKQVSELQNELLEREPENFVAIISCDVDRFKKINDRFGHKAGDTALQQITDIIMEIVRDGDLVVRWGGDEFVIVMPLHHRYSEVKPTDIARTLDTAIKERFKIEITAGASNLSLVGLSIGVTICSVADLGQISEMIVEADQAMYSVKERRNTRAARAALRLGARAAEGALDSDRRKPDVSQILTTPLQPL